MKTPKNLVSVVKNSTGSGYWGFTKKGEQWLLAQHPGTPLWAQETWRLIYNPVPSRLERIRAAVHRSMATIRKALHYFLTC